MRAICAAALLAACGGGEPELAYRGSLSNIEVQGLAFNVDEPTGHVGMLGQTCEFSADEGGLLQDIDASPSDDDDRVVDLWEHRLLAISSSGLSVVTLAEEVWLKPSIARHPLEDVLDAGFSADGELVALTRAGERCTVRWLDAGSTLELGGCAEDAALVTDPQSRRVWVHEDGVLSAVTPRRSTQLATASHAAYNPQLDVLYVSDRSRVRALDPATGSPLWEAEVLGWVDSLSAFGPSGALAVTELNFLVGLDPDGADRGAFPLPDHAQVIGSGDGEFLALLPDTRGVHFYTVER